MKIPAELIQKLRTARRVVAFTGAGISAESGVPTFRDAQSGLWAKYKPEDLATPEAFRRNPELVWNWYAWRRERVQSVPPNPGHYALAEMEGRLPELGLITQNVDGLHRRAGSTRIIELHGNIQRVRCCKEGKVVAHWQETGQAPPRCAECGGWLRPDVVWFGEALPEGALEAAQQATRECEVFLSIGTSTVVYPAAALPFAALEAGAMVVEINPEPTPLSARATHVLAGPAGRVLPELLAVL